VKNDIVMLDYAHRLHAEGTPFPEAVAAAARVRLRPILMTTLCTLLGLLYAVPAAYAEVGRR
jgi:HAE1 family hydrophobic/amphiphilic exporter-1